MSFSDYLDEDDVGTPRWETLPGWTSAHQGLNLYYRAFLSLIVVFLGAPILSLALAAVGLEKVAAVTWLSVPVAVVVVQVLVIIGIFKFTSVPDESGAKTLAVIALIGLGLGVALGLIDLFGSLGERLEPRGGGFRSRDDDGGTLDSLANLASTLGFLFLVLSTRAVAGFIGAVGVRRDTNLVLGLLGLFAGWFLLVLVAPEAVAKIGFSAILMTVALAIGLVVAGFIFLFAVGKLRDAIFVGVVGSGEDEDLS
jgi:hypothetical protein